HRTQGSRADAPEDRDVAHPQYTGHLMPVYCALTDDPHLVARAIHDRRIESHCRRTRIECEPAARADLRDSLRTRAWARTTMAVRAGCSERLPDCLNPRMHGRRIGDTHPDRPAARE